MNVAQLMAELGRGLGLEFRTDTVDTLKTGSLGAEVRGVCVTFLSSFPVLHRARELGTNLVITHEPTFYNHHDETSWLAGDSVYEAKRRLIDEAKLCVFRIHDSIHQRESDGILEGMLEKLDWTRFQARTGDKVLAVPDLTLRMLAEGAKRALGLDAVRVVGDPELVCHRLACCFGFCGFRSNLAELQRPDVQVLVCGEAHEWETYEYVRDAAAQGLSKGLIVLGHAASEEAGMATIARWFQQAHPELAVHCIDAGSPFALL